MDLLNIIEKINHELKQQENDRVNLEKTSKIADLPEKIQPIVEMLYSRSAIEQAIATIINAGVTHKLRAFCLSKRLLFQLQKSDQNVTKKLYSREYSKFLAKVQENKIIKKINVNQKKGLSAAYIFIQDDIIEAFEVSDAEIKKQKDRALAFANGTKLETTTETTTETSVETTSETSVETEDLRLKSQDSEPSGSNAVNATLSLEAPATLPREENNTRADAPNETTPSALIDGATYSLDEIKDLFKATPNIINNQIFIKKENQIVWLEGYFIKSQKDYTKYTYSLNPDKRTESIPAVKVDKTDEDRLKDFLNGRL